MKQDFSHIQSQKLGKLQLPAKMSKVAASILASLPEAKCIYTGLVCGDAAKLNT